MKEYTESIQVGGDTVFRKYCNLQNFQPLLSGNLFYLFLYLA